MKTNTALQNRIGFRNPAQKVWYAAHVLKAALTNSPAVLIRSASPLTVAKPEVLAQTAKPVRAATAAVPGTSNPGFAFGQLYLNSPAYPEGTPIPAISAKPASAAVLGSPAVVASPAITAVSAPAVVAVKGWEDAIQITKSAIELTVVAELPVITSPLIVGSSKVFTNEITPSALQATDWLDEIVYAGGQDNNKDVGIPTLEQYLYTFALDCNYTIASTTRMVGGILVACKKLTIVLYPTTGYQLDSNSLQLTEVSNILSPGS